MILDCVVVELAFWVLDLFCWLVRGFDVLVLGIGTISVVY